MKIAILTSGVLPIPAVNGGAVETLIDHCLEYNDIHKIHDITVFSIYSDKCKGQTPQKSEVNHYIYIHSKRWINKIFKYIFKITHNDLYYDYSIEYYLHHALKTIKKDTYDIILIENRPGYVLKIKKYINTKIIIHQENDYLNNQTPHYQTIYDSTTRIINASDYLTKQIRTINSNDKKSITVLNGIDTSKFYNSQPMNREKYGIKENDFVIVYSGRLTQDKGILQLIQAIKQLKINYKLLIIGASSYGKDKRPTPFITKLKEHSMPIKEKIIFTGFVDYHEIPSYLKMANIAVVPSMWEEPFGLTVVEAMAAGLPLITTRSGGIPEICEGVATIISRDNIIKNLSSAILDLYENPQKRTAMAKASIKRSMSYDKSIYAKNFFLALEGV